jgi:predicted N-acetyltransferase YhbS
MYLGLVAIRPGEMRRGLGRRIVAEAERIAAESGYRKIVLGTLIEMGNVDYYERVGYRVEGSEDFPPGHWGMTIHHRFRGMVKDL